MAAILDTKYLVTVASLTEDELAVRIAEGQSAWDAAVRHSRVIDNAWMDALLEP